MKRVLPILCMLMAAMWISAEELPTGYYDAIEGKSDSILKSTLHEIIKGGERFRYGPNTYHTTTTSDHKAGELKAIGTWGAFIKTDMRSDGSVWDMYGNTQRYFATKGASSSGLAIEHCFPKSWWGASSKETEYQKDDAYRDLYHLNPSDHMANTNKSNYAPGNVPVADKFDNGMFRMGKNSEYGDFYVFEPCDEYKGDFARAYFYIATAYEDRVWVNDGVKYAMTNDSYLEFKPWLIDVLLEWHRLDPVSDKEINRLDAISSLQHNRNPYIDYPELVEYIWGDKQGEAVALADLINTASDEYERPIEHSNPTAYEAIDVTSSGFTALWKNVDADSYELDVFTQTESGKYDTLFNMPQVNTSYLNELSENIKWLKADDTEAKTTGITDGGAAILMSTTSDIRHFLISGLDIQENAKLITKCSVAKMDQTATLVVTVDDEVLTEQELTLDEDWYTFDLPQGTQTIRLEQKELGDKKKGYHRISMQQIFIVEGDYTVTRTSIDGYPCMVESIMADIVLPQPIEDDLTLYYQVTPEGMRASNIMQVNIPQTTPTSINETAYNGEIKVMKYVENGRIVILMPNGEKYDILGVKIK